MAAKANASAPLALGAAPSSFVVELTGSLSRDCGGAAPCAGTPLTWSSGLTTSNASLLELPPTLTERFAPGASFEWKVRLKVGADAPWSEYATGSFDTAPAAPCDPPRGGAETADGDAAARPPLPLHLWRLASGARPQALGLCTLRAVARDSKFGKPQPKRVLTSGPPTFGDRSARSSAWPLPL